MNPQLQKYIPYLVVILALALIFFWPRSQDQTPATSSLADSILKKNAYLLDVRTLEEWDQGHIEQASLFEVARLEKGELPNIPRASLIYLYCRSGRRAETAKNILEQNGFKNVTNLGGMEEAQKLISK